MTSLIEANPPGTWQDLEDQVARILRECGYDVERQKNVRLARGDVNIDVWADDHSLPQNIIAVECKHWATPATKHEVHAFRSVVGDSGANTGFIVSTAGFQEGARHAAAYTNVRLLKWAEFQAMFGLRWLKQHMSPTLAEQTGALHEYANPLSSFAFGKAEALPPDRWARFRVLRERYSPLAQLNFLLYPTTLWGIERIATVDRLPLLDLPLRATWPELTGAGIDGLVPDDVLDATALRPLLDALIGNSLRATGEFDGVFGEQD